MERFLWNTGAQYAPRGQEIEARVEDGVIEFTDYCRGISGRIDGLPENWDKMTRGTKRSWIHQEYLHNRYSMSSEGGMWKRPAADQFPWERM